MRTRTVRGRCDVGRFGLPQQGWCAEHHNVVLYMASPSFIPLDGAEAGACEMDLISHWCQLGRWDLCPGLYDFYVL